MKTSFVCLAVIMTAITASVNAQQTAEAGPMTVNVLDKDSELKMFVIERNMPGVGETPVDGLADVSKSSCSVINDLGNADIQWVQSYFTGDKIYCIYKAKNIDLIKEHAKIMNIPADKISEIKSIVAQTTPK
ncbi:DUF4242 domain-containing protein [Robertkochia solimangrovi]|uniref:DUF4242 domain-containing protein n=1 Tax=Robertkochia solimangrovi TaxID=2213046 RepID=UPI0013A5A586|nr:DUF4242 domain-containing protein [Robertkochia solimangrovi]